MKKRILSILLIFLCVTSYSQHIRIGQLAEPTGQAAGKVVQTNGTGGYVLGNASITYPAAGIVVSTGSTWSASITDNSINWNTAYADRLKWDGGSTGLVPATGRTSLGGTTIGQNIFTLTNPSAITFPRFNADNTVSPLTASDFKAAIGGGVTNTPYVIKFDSGTTEGVDLFTFNGTSTKTIDVRAGANVSITKSGGTVTITASGGSSATGEIWTSLTGNYASATTFTITGTDKDAGLIEMSLFTCTNSTGATRRIGYVKTATNSSGTITCNVVTDTDLASGDKDFKIAYNRKVTDYMRLVTIPGECIADVSYSQGMFYSDIQTASYLLPVDASVITAAAGTGAALTWNVYADASTLFYSVPDMSTNTVLRSQRPTTNTIAAAANVSLRILSSAGATNKAADFQAKLYIVPQSIFTAFGMNWILIIGLISVAMGRSLSSVRINKKLIVIVILCFSFQGFGQIKGYWRLDGNSNDASGNSKNGLTYYVSWGSGISNSCGVFNGTSSYIYFSDVSYFSLSNLTMSAWIKTTNAGTGFRSIIIKDIAYCMVLSNNVFGTYDWNTNTTKSTGINLADGKWHHVACTLQSGVVNGTILYVDGVKKLTTTVTVFLQQHALAIGHNINGGQFFNGSIDEVIIDNSIWPEARVKNEYIERTINFSE